ncbi:DapH/DapD/GlmU-related protein [Paraglaciecola sp.]|uniref:DapH/DapD/GlmU-related protein n=1 Tax=Paraglaciecola sp. TaxID=1920173 RepID=UPI0030F38200
MKNRLIYLSLRILTIFTQHKIVTLDKHLKKFGYLANIDKYTLQGATIEKNSILINCTLSSSSKGDKFFIGELVKKELPRLSASRLSYRAPIRIGDNVFIDWGSIVLPSITIGDNVVIGAGNPAKVIKPINEYIEAYQEKLKKFPEQF